MARARPAARRSPRPRGFALAPRLTIYPEYALDPERWLDPGLRFPVLDRSRRRGPRPRRPGRVLPRADRGRRRRRRRRRGRARSAGASTAWYSGAAGRARRCSCPAPRPRPAARSARCSTACSPARRPARTRSSRCSRPAGREVAAVAEVADELRRRRRRRRRHLGPQPQHQLHERLHVQVPVLRLLEGPAVAQPAGHARTCSTLDDIAERVRRGGRARAPPRCACRAASTPSFDGDYYIDVARAVQDAAPDIHIHGFTALEVTEGAKRLGEPLGRLPAPAAWTPGCARCPAPRPRSSTTRSAPSCAPTRSTPRSGSRPTAPPTASACARTSRSCSASIEQPVHWARHLVRTRDLQKETGGFTEFVPAAVRAHGGADLPPAQGPPGPDVPRGAADARRRPHRLPRAASTTSRCRG